MHIYFPKEKKMNIPCPECSKVYELEYDKKKKEYNSYLSCECGAKFLVVKQMVHTVMGAISGYRLVRIDTGDEFEEENYADRLS